jgi:hypothetical protein
MAAGNTAIYYGDMHGLATKFSENINIQVLRECDGNIQYAIEKLVTLSG